MIPNQKRNSSFFSNLVFFIGISTLLFATFFAVNRYYQQNKNELADYELTKETFDPIPDEELPKPKERIEREKLKELTIPETIARQEAQKNWKKNVFPYLSNKKTKTKISDFLETFYSKFLKEGLNSNERKWRRENKFIRPKKVEGRATTKETLNSDIEKCKKIFPKSKKSGPDWKRFDGWLTEKEKGEKEKDNTVLMGLCINEGGTNFQYEKSWGKETLCHWTYRRISIKLKPELFFFRYNSWIERIDKKNAKPIQIKIGWKQTIETIAHELAHAVINTILIDDKVAKLDEGGHGTLHDNITDRIEKMINEDHPEYVNFKNYMESLDNYL